MDRTCRYRTAAVIHKSACTRGKEKLEQLPCEHFLQRFEIAHKAVAFISFSLLAINIHFIIENRHFRCLFDVLAQCSSFLVWKKILLRKDPSLEVLPILTFRISLKKKKKRKYPSAFGRSGFQEKHYAHTLHTGPQNESVLFKNYCTAHFT